MTGTTILDQIVADKKLELVELKKIHSLEDLKQSLSLRQTAVRDFAHALSTNPPSLIAEIKKASPSEGVIREDFNPVEIAKIYADSGLVNAISVLTEQKYFQGDLSYLKVVKDVSGLPVLRKDFLFDEYQVYEAYLAEADAILLIVSILTEEELTRLITVAQSLGLACLVETHSQEEIEIALHAGAKIIGINVRDLKTFKMNFSLFSELARQIPDGILKVAESGMHTYEDVIRMKESGADVVLIGTSLMRAPDIAQKLQQMMGKEKQGE